MALEQQYTAEQLLVELTNRLRVLESKQSILSERLLVVNQTMIEEYKRLLKEIRDLAIQVKELKAENRNMANIVKHLTDEAKDFAKVENLKVLEKYINLWNPLRFVTESDVQRIVEDELKKNHGRRTTHKSSSGTS